MIKDTEIGHHIDRHGDGIKDVALTVDDAEIAWKSCIERGAKSAMPPLEVKDENGQAVMASIHTFGDTIHTFIERIIIKAFSCLVIVNIVLDQKHAGLLI